MVRLDLIHLTTYSDRDADTVDTEFYFARQPVLFDFDNSGTDREFWPVLEEVGPLSTSIHHLPSPDDASLLRKPWRFTLSNEPYGAAEERLINTLRDGHTLENARVEWTQILLDARPTTVRLDLSALTGNEHTFWYRGRVLRVGPITDESIGFECELDVPDMAWLSGADTAETDPDHIGVRVALVAGEAKKVACINWDVGAISTLAAAITSTYTGDWELSDASRFPTSGEAGSGIEQFTWTGKSSNSLTGVTRGANGTHKTNHAAGDAVVELITTAVFLVADHEVSAIGDVYCQNPYNDRIVRLDPDFYTATVADTTTISGRTVASISFTQEQLRDTLVWLASGSTRQDLTQTVLQRPVAIDWDANLSTSGDGAQNFHSVKDGYYDPGFDASDPPWCDLNADGKYFWLKFVEPAAGYTTQDIKVVASGGNSDTVKMRIYAGRYGLDSDVVLVDTITVAFPAWALYSTGALDEVGHGGWITIYCEQSGGDLGYLSMAEVWREISGCSATVTAIHGDDATWSDSGVPEPLTNLHDDNTSTYGTMTSNDWISGVFPHVDEDSYDSQRIKINFRDIDDNEELRIYVDGSTILGKGDPPTLSSFVFEVRKGFTVQTAEDYEFETEVKGDTIVVYCDSGTIAINEISRELLVYEPDTSSATVRIQGASIGYGLQLFADVDGFEVPSGASPAYKAGVAGTLIKKPCDILRYLIEEVGGESIETTSYDACNTNLGAVELACDLRTMGLTLEEVLARVAFESRTTLVPEETLTGRQWKMLSALSTYAFPAASGSVTEWDRGGFAEVGRALRDELATRFLFFYAPDWTRGAGEEAYTAVVVANEDGSDLAVPDTAAFVAAVADYGNIEAPPIAFRALRALASAEEIAGYYAHELIRGGALFAISGVPWFESYALEVGDIINVQPPWAAAAVKARIIQYTKDPGTEQVELRLVEVE
jgi:hypothetical protein